MSGGACLAAKISPALERAHRATIASYADADSPFRCGFVGKRASFCRKCGQGEQDMDRDQVNCIHHLYQGDPADRIARAVLYGQTGGPKLVWCNSDTVEPLLGGILQEGAEGLELLPGCFNFLDRVEDQLRQLPKPDYAFGYPFSARIRKPGEARPAFLAIPYSPLFDGVKFRVVEACRSKSFRCDVTGDLSAPGAIMDQVWQGIRSADVVIADITGDNPNVLFEVGLSAALGKEVIVMSKTRRSRSTSGAGAESTTPLTNWGAFPKSWRRRSRRSRLATRSRETSRSFRPRPRSQQTQARQFAAHRFGHGGQFRLAHVDVGRRVLGGKIAPALKRTHRTGRHRHNLAVEPQFAAADSIRIHERLDALDALPRLDLPSDDPVERAAGEDFFHPLRDHAGDMDVARGQAPLLGLAHPRRNPLPEVVERVRADAEFYQVQGHGRQSSRRMDLARAGGADYPPDRRRPAGAGRLPLPAELRRAARSPSEAQRFSASGSSASAGSRQKEVAVGFPRA